MMLNKGSSILVLNQVDSTASLGIIKRPQQFLWCIRFL